YTTLFRSLLAAVHGGQQHVQVAEGIRQAQSSGEGEGKVVGVAPARKFWVERYRFGADPPTERFEQCPGLFGTGSAGYRRQTQFQRDRGTSQFGALCASAAQRCAQNLTQRHGEQ